MPETAPSTDRAGIAAVGALYPGAERGLAVDILTARALGLRVFPVCTSLAMATDETVSDFVEVPEDAVRSQLEHLDAVASVRGVKLGVLAQHGTARHALDWAARVDGPVVLDLQVSGPAAETVLSRRGFEEVVERLHIPDIVLVDRTDAELLSGGEVRSLDDAQVAVQRIARRGARAILLKAGVLPSRHFDTDITGDGAPSPFATDLFYDGSEFALFEAPWLESAPRSGASSAHGIALLSALVEGTSMEDSLRRAKEFVTEALRNLDWIGGERSPRYFSGY
jgi:hydroxymethylpyrimidine/phosphomethylpyrimidine kinase